MQMTQMTQKHNKWLQILFQEDFPPKLLWSENADFKFRVNNEGEDKGREGNLAWICLCLDQQKSLILRLNRGRKILEGGTRLPPNVCSVFGLHAEGCTCQYRGSSSLIGRQLTQPKGPNCIFVIVARHPCFLLYLVTTRTKLSACKPIDKSRLKLSISCSTF